jgi:hypothetical protein
MFMFRPNNNDEQNPDEDALDREWDRRMEVENNLNNDERRLLREQQEIHRRRRDAQYEAAQLRRIAAVEEQRLRELAQRAELERQELALAIDVIELAGMFDVTPPPVKYLTVNVVFEGAITYVLVNKKFSGE